MTPLHALSPPVSHTAAVELSFFRGIESKYSQTMGGNHWDKEPGRELCGPSLQRSHKNTMMPLKAEQIG